MKKLVYLIIVIVALGLIIAGCIPTVPLLEQDESGTLLNKATVNPGDSIQDAINVATPGDTITVAPGMYYGFTIDKEIILQGENRDTTFIDGQLSFQTIKITASNVTITGFTFCNSRSFDLVTDTKNIQNNIRLSNNIFEGRIQLYSVNSFEISNNQMSGPSSVWVSSGNISGNTMDNVLMGIVVISCNDVAVCDNTINARVGENTDDGINIQGSSNIFVEGNTIIGFTAGERLHYTYGTDGAGISISVSTNYTVSENDLFGNTLGILVEKAIEGSEIHINNNNLEGNTEFGVLNCGSWTGKDGTYTPASATIDATRNWWDHKHGPSRAMGVAEGHDDNKGDRVSPNVKFAPWLKAPY